MCIRSHIQYLSLPHISSFTKSIYFQYYLESHIQARATAVSTQLKEKEDVTTKSMDGALLLQHMGVWELNLAWLLIEFYSKSLQEGAEW